MLIVDFICSKRTRRQISDAFVRYVCVYTVLLNWRPVCGLHKVKSVIIFCPVQNLTCHKSCIYTFLKSPVYILFVLNRKWNFCNLPKNRTQRRLGAICL